MYLEEKPSVKLQIVEDTSSENHIEIENKNNKQTGAKRVDRTTTII